VAVRIGGESIGQTKGFYLNPVNGQYYDRTDGWLGRAQVLYRHGPLSVDWLVDGQDLHLPAFVSGYAIAPGTLATVPLGFTNNRFNVPSDGRNDTQQKVYRSQLLANLDLGWATLSSTSMISNFDSLQYYGSSIDLNIETQLQGQGEIGAYPLAQVHTGVDDRTLYEDLHLAGKAFGGALDWLGGVEFLDQHDGYVLSSATSPCTLTAKSSVCGGTPADHVCYQLLPTDAACPATYPAAFGSVSFTRQRYTSEAAYGSLRYTVDNFTFSGELRYTDDLKTATQTVAALYTNVVTGTPTNYKFRADRTNYTATISYKLPGDDLLYVKTGTGYRAGGVNTGTFTAAAPTPFSPTYGDEGTVSYEAGIKGNLGSHIYATLDTYTSSTDNAITSITDGCTLLNACKKAATVFNINGGTVHAHGVELALDGHFHVAGGRLALSVNGANQQAHFVSVNGTYAGLPIVGSKVAQIPDWTSSASVDYSHSLPANTQGFFHLTYNSQSGGGQDTVTSAAPFVPLANVTDVSLRTGVRFQRIEVALFADNLTNQTYRLLTLQSAGITTAVRYNQPRTIGANLIYRW
jgi:iron complex outermembrane receptor protein